MGSGHEQAADRHEQQTAPHQVAGRDLGEKPTGQGSGEEGHHRDREEAQTSVKGLVTEIVLEIESQVQEHGEDRCRDGEGGD